MKWDNLIDLFLKLNSQLNLSAIRDADGVYHKHILDALELEKAFPLTDKRKICDIGTGGGFPLLPLAMRYPKVQFVGIDARKKKIEAVNQLIKELEISNAQAIRTRSEDYQGAFDVVMARAVGYIDKIIPWSYHLLKKGGHFVFYKQVSAEERADLMKLCKEYSPAKDGTSLTLVHEHLYRLGDEDIARVIYIVKKN